MVWLGCSGQNATAVRFQCLWRAELLQCAGLRALEKNVSVLCNETEQEHCKKEKQLCRNGKFQWKKNPRLPVQLVF